MWSIKKNLSKSGGVHPPPLELASKIPGKGVGVVATSYPSPTLAPLVEATPLTFSNLSSGNTMDSLAFIVLQDKETHRLV